MLLVKSKSMEPELEQMWNTHRECVRRMLISLTRDIDLAEDVLQDTYLRARDGFDGYRGGDARAWLSVIAKNAFYAYTRRKYFGSEVELDSETPTGDDLLGSRRHVDGITIRQAIAYLPEAQRQALLMKHYGGFTYSEIAQYLGCPQGTAQHRVFAAVRKLREALGTMREEFAEMACGELSGKKLVDYAYGKLSAADMAAVKEHLEECPKCRSEVDETAEVFRALDSVESSYKFILFAEEWRSYLTITAPMPAEGEQQPFEIGPHWRVVYAAMEGEEVVTEEMPSEDPNRHRYILHFPREVEAGEIIEIMFVAEQDRWDTSREEVLTSHGGHCLPVDAVWLTALRLGENATLVSTDPEPDEVRTNGHTTVYYRRFLRANETFEWTVKHRKR